MYGRKTHISCVHVSINFDGANTVLLKGNVAHTCNFIAIYECVSNLSSVYRACILFLEFWFLEIKTIVAKESSTTGYKYLDSFIHKRVSS